MNNVIYYLYQSYYVIGLDTDVMFNQQIYDAPTSIATVPKVISKFPSMPTTNILIPDELITMHCFPKGFRLIKDKPTKISRTIIFSLDNIPFNKSSPYNKMYFTAIIFYENLYNYHLLRIKKNKEANTKDALKYQKYYVPKAIVLSSLLPFPRETAKILKGLYGYYAANYDSITIPIEKTIENILYMIPIPPRGNFMFTYSLFGEKIIFGQTAINRLPNSSHDLNIIFGRFKIEVLLKLFKCILLEIPLIFYSENIDMLTTITEGIMSLTYPFRYQYPFISVLPSNMYSLIETANTFVVGINEDIMKKNDQGKNFFERNGLEIEDKTIIVVNIDIDKEQITMLKPTGDIRPCIYLNDLDYISTETQMYINGLFDSVEFPLHYKKKCHKLISDYINQLKEKKIKNEDKETFNYMIREQFFYFLVSILVKYQNYIKVTELKTFDLTYVSKKRDAMRIEDLFDVEGYINDSKTSDAPFYKRFLHTKIFLDFMIRKIYPKTTYEKISLIFFDEKIFAKQNRFIFSRSTKTPLIENKELATKKTQIDISTVKTFTNEEIAYIKSNINNALQYYQDYSSLLEKDEFSVMYQVYPKLLYDDIFFNKPYAKIHSSNRLSPPMDYVSMQERIFEDIVGNKKYTNIYSESDNGYSLDLYKRSEDNKVKMYNYIDLTWLMMAAGTLWYCDSYERSIRINKIFEVLDKIEYVEEDIYQYLFMALIKYSDDANVIKMYEMMMKIETLGKENYINYALLCMKLSNVYKRAASSYKKKKKSSKITLLMRESEIIDEEERRKILLNTVINNNNKFRKRTLFNGYPQKEEDNDDESYLKEEIKFENKHSCDFCSKEYDINLNRILDMEKNSEDMKFPCPNCKKDVIRGSLRIKVMCVKHSKGTDANPAKPLLSYIDVFGLLTPIEMFNFSRNFFLISKGIKMDIESIKKIYEKLFYNFIFYFALRNLPYDFILPYKKKKDDTEIKSDKHIRYEFSHLEVDSNVINETVTANQLYRAVTTGERYLMHLNASFNEFKGRRTKKTKSVQLDYSIKQVLLNKNIQRSESIK